MSPERRLSDRIADSIVQPEAVYGESGEDGDNPLTTFESQMDTVDDSGIEEDKTSQSAFEEAFEHAADPSNHTNYVKELLSYMGLQTGDPSLPWEKVFFDLFELSDSVKSQVFDFGKSSKAKGDRFPQHEDYDKPRCATRTSWPSSNDAIDKKWNVLVDAINRLSGGSIITECLTKPTGQLHAPLAIVWNYPTWRTSNTRWMQVLDYGNPCLRMQYAKLGPNPHIRTQNRIPVREAWQDVGVVWDQYPNWKKIEDKCLEFCRWLNKKSKVIILVGKENCMMPRNRLIEMGSSLELLQVQMNCPKTLKLFGQRPRFELIRDRQTKEIHHIIFLAVHTQTFFHDGFWNVRAYHDFAWNAACGLLDIPVPRPNYFVRQAFWFKKRPDLRLKWSQLNRAKMLRAGEKLQKTVLTRQAVQAAFRKTLDQNPSFNLAPDKNGSYVGAIIRLFVSKAWMKQQTNQWRSSPEADKMFGTSISNLLSSVSISKRQATERAASWKYTEAAKSQKSALLQAARGPKKHGAWPARIDALHKTKQVRERLAADPSTLSVVDLNCQRRLSQLRSDSSTRVVSYFKAHVICYSTTNPRGLRFRGDGGPDRDEFPYEEVDHPAVKLLGVWTKAKRQEFHNAVA
ncbi:hypothetical protein N7541_010294 [Penicillium brevicompactum]|uniref:Uncharacterized protein n=1 Tax=Penicillium brevicompactum TaxID=5074 RepID=A0A9W9QPS0_PENBR|nr:hypothetical protein N7541_010294 [Penicillium brevicompactum]